MTNVYTLKRRAIPETLIPCLEKMLESAHKGTLTGIAFVGFIDGHGYIADTCGEASLKIEDTRKMLKRLDAKLARRQLGSRV